MSWHKTYRFRHKFTIDADLIDAALTDFPVALVISSAAGTGDRDLTKVFDIVGANWTNLCVCGADGQTPLWTEVDLWDAANESGVLHVKVPKVGASADTDLYLYFDTDGLGNGYIGKTGSTAAQNVWDEDFVSVWHMATDPSGTSAFRDSTSNGLHGTMVGTMLTEDLVAGQIGKAIDFDGSNDEFTVADNALHNIDAAKDWTCEAVVNKDEGTVRACIFDKRYAGASTGWLLGIHEDDVPHFLLNDGTDSVEPAGSTAMTVDGTTWYHVAGVFDRTGANTAAVYLNGGIDCAPVSTAAIGDCTRSYPLHVGDQGYSGSSWGSFNGKMSELRLSDTVRSAAWLKATYNTLFDSLGAWAAVEAISAAPAGAWLGTWKYRLALTVASTNIDARLTDFPLAVFLSAAAGTGDADVSAVFDELGANSHKIAITDHTGNRQLFVEVDTWDSATESAVLHTKVPHVDLDTSTLLYLYYDANQADNDGFVGDTGDAAAQSVWDVNFLGVYHFSQDLSAGNLLDSTANEYDGTPTSFEAGDTTAGQVGKKVSPDGAAEFVSSFNAGIIVTGAAGRTTEILAYPDASATPNMIYLGGTANYTAWSVLYSTSEIGIGFVNCRRGVAGAFDNTLRHIALWYPSGSTNTNATGIMINGVDQTVTLTSGADSTVNTINTAGSAYTRVFRNSSTTYASNVTDEIRISNIRRSDAWLKATYYTLFDGLSAWAAAAETFTGIGWLRGFTKRIKILAAATNVDATLHSFPVAILLSSSCGTGSQDLTQVFDEVGANSKKIAITTDDGATQLPVEIDHWDSTGETAVLHTRVPALDSNQTTVLYLYYSADVPDNDEFVGTTGEAPGMSVWDQYFAGVWHLSTDPSGTAPQGLDSTVNGLHGTSVGTMTSADLVDGVIGKGTDFDGSDDYYDVADCAVLDAITFPHTLEAIIKVTADWVPSNQDYTGILFKGATYAGIGFRMYERNADSSTRVEFGQTSEIVANSFANGAWKYIAGVAHLTANDQLFIDGADVAPYDTAAKTVFAANDYNLRIGDLYPVDADRVNFPGIISEARLSSTDRSAAWIKATYYSMYDDLLSYQIDVQAEDVWLGSWANRVQVRIDSSLVDGELTNFPVALHLNSTAGIGSQDLTAIFDDLGANSLKIAVTDEAGDQLYVEIDTWDNANETAVLHVKVPTVYMGRDTLLYLYYDSTQSDNSTYVGVAGSTPGKAVWDANFLGVYHFSDNLSAGTLTDSTSNANNGTASNFEAGDTVAGLVGKHVTPDGAAESIGSFAAGLVVTGTSERTTEIVAYPDQSGWTFPIHLGGGGTRDAWAFKYSPTEIAAALSNCRRGVTGAFDNTCRYIAAWYPSGQTNSDQVGLNINGVNQSVVRTSGTDGAINTVNTYRRFFLNQGTDYSANVTDEIRISNVRRADAWLKATYHTLFDTLVAFASPLALAGDHHWPCGWKFRRSFTVPATNIDADLDGFPLAMILDTTAGTGSADISSIFDEVGANSKRVMVTTNHGKPLPAEIDYWASGSEAAVLHFKAPHIDAVYGAAYYLYYDDDRYDDEHIGDTGDAIAKRVWDSNFVGVYHLSQDPSGSAPQMKDSTANANHMTSVGTMLTADLEAVAPGAGLDFDGSDDGLYVNTPTGLPTAYPMTMECAGPGLPVSSVSTNPMMGICDKDVTNQQMGLSCNDTYARVMAYNTTAESVFGTQALAEGTFYHLAGVFTGAADRHVLTNGADKVQDTDSMTFAANVDRLTIGYFGDSSPTYGDGKTSEARLSNIVRADAWLKGTYYTLADSLGSWGAEVQFSEGVVTLEEPLNKAGRIDFTPHAIADVLSMTEALSKAGRIDFTAYSLTEIYVGNLLKMTAASGSRPKILTATGTKAQISAAAGARPRLAAAEAYEYQERD